MFLTPMVWLMLTFSITISSQYFGIVRSAWGAAGILMGDHELLYGANGKNTMQWFLSKPTFKHMLCYSRPPIAYDAPPLVSDARCKPLLFPGRFQTHRI